MSDFLNPKSMLTPGIAGALMMFLANALCATFPEIAFRYVALGLSFALGLIVFRAAKIGLTEKATYWFLNSLIIFSTGVGASNIAANIERPAQSEPHGAAVAMIGPLVDWFVPDAAAQTWWSTAARTDASNAGNSGGAAPDVRNPSPGGAARTEDRRREVQSERSGSDKEAREERDKEQFFRKEDVSRTKGFFRRW